MSGSPGKDGAPHQGAIKFGDTADVCTLSTAGTVRYTTSQNALQLCDGSAWLSVVTAGKGHVAYNPGSHCLDILKSGEFLIEQHCQNKYQIVTVSYELETTRAVLCKSIVSTRFAN